MVTFVFAALRPKMAARTNSREAYKSYSEAVSLANTRVTLRWGWVEIALLLSPSTFLLYLQFIHILNVSSKPVNGEAGAAFARQLYCTGFIRNLIINGPPP